MKKPDLLLVHSFPTNSILLHGLEEFLSDFFTVHFIDLPGFHKQSLPFSDAITLKKFSNYFDRKIAELDANEYVVGGVSFGFLVINNARLDKRCKAIMAMEPFINTECLNIPYWRQKSYFLMASILRFINFFDLGKFIWTSVWFNRYLQRVANYPKERIDIIIKSFDPRTFFTVASMLLIYNKKPKFHPLPYFLVGNFADETINFEKAVEIFIKNLTELHIASEPIDHYPKNLTKEYFKSRVPKEHISRIIACMENYDYTLPKE